MNIIEESKEETAGQEFLRMVKESGIYIEPYGCVYLAVFGDKQVVFIFSFGSNRIIYSDRGIWMNGKVIENNYLKFSILRLIQRTYCNPEEVTFISGAEAKRALKGVPLIPISETEILTCRVE